MALPVFICWFLEVAVQCVNKLDISSKKIATC